MECKVMVCMYVCMHACMYVSTNVHVSLELMGYRWVHIRYAKDERKDAPSKTSEEVSGSYH